MTRSYGITGSSGYIGTRMTAWLLDHEPEARIIGFDVRPPHPSIVEHPQRARFSFQTLDVRDRSLGARLRQAAVESVLHFAFIVDPLYNEKEMSDIDLGGTRNVLDATLAAQVGYLLCTSSTTAYGARADNPIPLTEADPTRAGARFNYAHDKRQMDQMVREFAAAQPAVDVCILRPCIVLGPNVSNSIAATLLELPVGLLFDGHDPPGQFIHEDDLVVLVALCLQKRATGVFNAVGQRVALASELASRQGKRTLRVSSRAAEALSWLAWKARLTTYASPPGMIDFLKWPWVASGQKAERELGFVPRYSTQECFDILLARKVEILTAFKQKMKERGRR